MPLVSSLKLCRFSCGQAETVSAFLRFAISNIHSDFIILYNCANDDDEQGGLSTTLSVIVAPQLRTKSAS